MSTLADQFENWCDKLDIARRKSYERYALSFAVSDLANFATNNRAAILAALRDVERLRAIVRDSFAPTYDAKDVIALHLMGETSRAAHEREVVERFGCRAGADERGVCITAGTCRCPVEVSEIAMPICTYLNDRECLQPTSDRELNEVLAEARKVTGADWRVRESTETCRRGWFGRSQTVKRYWLYNHVDSCEYQVINFYRNDDADSINISNDAELVVAYLYGVLAGAALSK